ncbi:MAG: glycosyl hydrolase family 28 protein [Candidatus Hydrogenedentes bacterium]|nr:glycosyl hydrolase family 28 protein [Candidatus Hydrogenedentota bacterium]
MVRFIWLFVLLCVTSICANASGAFSVREYGAKGDGETKDTAAVQKAIDDAAKAGGGAVLFSAGTYLCGSLHLCSHVGLSLEAGATLKGSPDKDDYDPYEKLDFKNDADSETSFFHFALIWGEDIENIAITGSGTIDSNRDRRHGPKTIALKRCRFVTIRDVRLLNAPNYNISMIGTDFVTIDGVTILNGFADGIDPDSCRNVRIANCHIEASDDAIVPKASFALGERRSCENIAVTNCYLATDAHAFKLGTESGGDFKRIAVSNCVMSGMAGGRPARGGIALESVDGSNIDDVAVSNISMVDVRAPIFIRLGNRGRDMATPTPGSLRNVVISEVVATGASNTCSVSGIPDHPVVGVTLSNIRIAWKGGCPFRNPDEPVPENIDEYPDPNIFDALPAYGFYCRHVEGLRMSNLDLGFDDTFWRIVDEGKKSRARWGSDGVPHPSKPGQPGYAIVFDDVTRLDLDGFRARTAAEGPGTIRMVDVRDALLRGCVAPDTAHFLEVLGHRSAGIHLKSNVLAAGEAVVMKDCDATAVSVAN